MPILSATLLFQALLAEVHFKSTIFTNMGLILILASPFVFLIGFILLFPKTTRKKGGYLLLSGMVMLLIGFGMCAGS